MPPGFQEWAESVSLWQLVGWSAGAVGVFLFFWKGWPWLRRFATAVVNFATIVDSVHELPKFIKRTDAAFVEQNETLAKQDAAIAVIRHEVEYNNGSSVKDGVQRVETGLAGLHVEVATIASELAQAKETLTLSDGRIRQDLEERRAVEDTRSDEES